MSRALIAAMVWSLCSVVYAAPPPPDVATSIFQMRDLSVPCAVETYSSSIAVPLVEDGDRMRPVLQPLSAEEVQAGAKKILDRTQSLWVKATADRQRAEIFDNYFKSILFKYGVIDDVWGWSSFRNHTALGYSPPKNKYSSGGVEMLDRVYERCQSNTSGTCKSAVTLPPNATPAALVAGTGILDAAMQWAATYTETTVVRNRQGKPEQLARQIAEISLYSKQIEPVMPYLAHAAALRNAFQENPTSARAIAIWRFRQFMPRPVVDAALNFLDARSLSDTSVSCWLAVGYSRPTDQGGLGEDLERQRNYLRRILALVPPPPKANITKTGWEPVVETPELALWRFAACQLVLSKPNDEASEVPLAAFRSRAAWGRESRPCAHQSGIEFLNAAKSEAESAHALLQIYWNDGPASGDARDQAVLAWLSGSPYTKSNLEVESVLKTVKYRCKDNTWKEPCPLIPHLQAQYEQYEAAKSKAIRDASKAQSGSVVDLLLALQQQSAETCARFPGLCRKSAPRADGKKPWACEQWERDRRTYGGWWNGNLRAQAETNYYAFCS
jgi:hypothetical protein